MPSLGQLLEPKASKLKLLESMFDGETFLCMLSISVQFTFESAPQAKIAKKLTKPSYFGNSRSLTQKAHQQCKSVLIHNLFHTGRDNSSKITTF